MSQVVHLMFVRLKEAATSRTGVCSPKSWMIALRTLGVAVAVCMQAVLGHVIAHRHESTVQIQNRQCCSKPHTWDCRHEHG
jgi:hypothetical protein